MNYKKHYDLLIERARNRILESYTERHHVIPRCQGGDDSENNIVLLTPEEHFLAHQLLVKINPKEPSLIYAANMMTVSSENVKRNNKRYGWLKRKYLSECRKRTGSKNPSYGKSWYYDPNTLENGKFSKDNIPEGWLKGRVPPKSTKCIVCENKTNSPKAKWCNDCRPKREKTVFRNTKTKDTYSVEEKEAALKMFNGNIRKSLMYLGLSDGGTHYKVMTEIKKNM